MLVIIVVAVVAIGVAVFVCCGDSVIGFVYLLVCWFVDLLVCLFVCLLAGSFVILLLLVVTSAVDCWCYWFLVVGCSLLVVGRWSLVVVAAACYLFIVGCRSLVVGF